MNLYEIRKKIDLIDAEILRLLNKRMELVVRTKKLKKEIADPTREEELRANIRRNSTGLIRQEFAENVFNEIISESKKIQERELRLAGFQGEHGAYGEIAVRRFDSSAVPIPCTEFVDVFEGVKSGQLDIGVVPVENSIEGAVDAVNDLLIETELHIIGEINVPIHHCLLALPETDYRDIRVVYSHPQALGQCRGFLTRNKLEQRPYYDTAGAALMLVNERPKATAVIASKLCAEIYGLEILKENIEDQESNSTRFLVLSKEKSREKGNKCSVVFSTPHRAGALFAVLKVFSDAGINLTRIESRPIRGERKIFAFLLDFQGSETDEKVVDALENVRKITTSFKLLGCYTEAIS